MEKREKAIELYNIVVDETAKYRAMSGTVHPLNDSFPNNEKETQMVATYNSGDDLILYLLENFDLEYTPEQAVEYKKECTEKLNNQTYFKQDLNDSSLSDIAFAILAFRNLIAIHKAPFHTTKMKYFEKFSEKVAELVLN